MPSTVERSPKRSPNVTIGLDLGDRSSRTYEVDRNGLFLSRDSVPTTREGMLNYFGTRQRCRVVLEVGTHSPWVARLLEQLGHEAIVANPSAMYGKRRRQRNDDRDAEFLARQGRADVKLVCPIQ